MKSRSLQTQWLLFVTAVLLFHALESNLNAAAPTRTDQQSSSDIKTGSIEGSVIYQTDAKRRWRYARYYIKDRKKGALAEAVVAIAGPSLKKHFPPKQAKTSVIDQKDFRFIPEIVAIRTGDRVKFLNSDDATHNVSAFHLRHSFSVNMPAGGTHIEKFPRGRTIRQPYRIGCVYHSAMRAWIFVFDHPCYQLTGTDGRFRLENVPVGKYNLEMAHPAGELRWRQKVEVKANQTTRVDIRVSPDDKKKKKSKTGETR